MNTTSEKVRVLIVDDSALMRKLLTSVLSADDGIEVVGAAPDPFAAREQIKALNPDVVTLDVEMPHMNGIDFLRKIMELRPTPVIMISTLTQAGAETTLEALEIGAVDFVAKPLDPGAVMQLGDELIPKIKAAALTRPRRRIAAPQQRPVRKALGASSGGPSDKLIAIGASTGGVEALKAVLMLFPEDTPPVVIAQHMPERFTAAFARRLDGECRMRVHEAAHDQPIERGHVYIAPGGHHLEVARRSSGLVCTLNDGPLVSGHRPSVDALFNSVARRRCAARRRRHPHRHGTRRRQRAFGDAQGRLRDARPGRGNGAGLWHAARRLRDRRGPIAAWSFRHIRRHSRRLRGETFTGARGGGAFMMRIDDFISTK